jgi:Helix-turn-helix domain
MKSRKLIPHESPLSVKRKQRFRQRERLCRIHALSEAGSLNPNGEALPIPSPLPRHLRPRREKVFGDGRPRPLDRNAKARIMHLARALMHRTEPGKAYGALTAKAVAVLEALLWCFHNARSGLCYPSYETIAEKAGCARSTVAEALKALELAGVLSWVHRLKRVSERCADLFGHMGSRVRVIRTSNGYQFNDPSRLTGFLLSPIFSLEPQIKILSLLLRPLPKPKSTPQPTSEPHF